MQPTPRAHCRPSRQSIPSRDRETFLKCLQNLFFGHAQRTRIVRSEYPSGEREGNSLGAIRKAHRLILPRFCFREGCNHKLRHRGTYLNGWLTIFACAGMHAPHPESAA